MDKRALKQELEKKEEIIDALSAAIRNNKEDVNKAKAENDKLRTELKRRDDFQSQMPNKIDELEIEVAKGRALAQRCICHQTMAEEVSDSAYQLDRRNNKEDVKKAKGELDKLRAELKRRDDLQTQMQNEIDELEIEVAKGRALAQRFPDFELGSESFYSYERPNKIDELEIEVAKGRALAQRCTCHQAMAEEVSDSASQLNRFPDFELGSESFYSYERPNKIDELEIEVAKGRALAQRRNNKVDVKKGNAELDKLRAELKRRDDLQAQMQNDIDELEIEVAKGRALAQRRKNKVDVKKGNAELDKLRAEIKRRDELQTQMQNDIDELEIEVAKGRALAQRRNNKVDVKKGKAELDKLRAELKRRDDLQTQMQNNIDELEIEVAKGRALAQRRNNKVDVMKAKAELDKLRAELKRRDDLQTQMQNKIDELEIEVAKGGALAQRLPKTMSSANPMDQSARKSRKSQAKGLLVAAIDIGTTYSGYAYSFIYEYIIDPLKIYTNNRDAGSPNLISMKTPSTILLDENKKFVAFGYEAEDMFGDLALYEEHEKFYYFRRFVGHFSEASASGFRKDMVLRDYSNKTIPALELFSMAIKYICDHLMELLAWRISSVKVNDITWVLTVPAIWNDGTKQMMREAALDAGIDNANLTIALQPEAASLLCMSLPVTRFNDNKNTIGSTFADGTQYMMLDVGGELVQMSIYKVVNRTTLTELNRASCGACGGTRVDECFKQLLVTITGRIPFDKFCQEYCLDYVDLFREFEEKKRHVTSGTTKQTIRLPTSLLQIYEDVTQRELKKAVDNCAPYKGKLRLTGGTKLRVDANVFKSLFDEPVSNIIQHAKDMLGQKASAGTDTIVLVGGFSDSPMLQEAIRRHFRDKRVIIPEDAGLAVLKGAVLFGHNPLVDRS